MDEQDEESTPSPTPSPSPSMEPVALPTGQPEAAEAAEATMEAGEAAEAAEAGDRPLREPLEHTRIATCDFEWSNFKEAYVGEIYNLLRFESPIGGVSWTLAEQTVSTEDPDVSSFSMRLILKDVCAEQRDKLCIKVEATVTLDFRSRPKKTIAVKKLLAADGEISLCEEASEPRDVTFWGRVSSYYRNAPCAACVDWSRLRDCRELAEVTFVVADADVAAHKQVLCARSPVFRSMFSHDFKESRESKVVVEGVSLPAFLKFLEYLYSGQVQDFEGLELEVMVVADRYHVDGLKVLCQREMFDKVDTNNVLETLILADKVNAPLLKTNALSVAVDNIKAVMTLPMWRDFHREHNHLVDDVLREACLVRP